MITLNKYHKIGQINALRRRTDKGQEKILVICCIILPLIKVSGMVLGGVEAVSRTAASSCQELF